MKRSRPVFEGAENLAALVYLCSVSAVMMYLLCRDHAVICTVIMTVLCGGIYMLFYALRNKRLISFLVFMAMFAGVVLVCSSVGAVKGTVAIVQFIYDTSDYFDVMLAGAVIVLFSFIVTYPVFYFTVRLPRPCFLLLPALAPLILGARTVGVLPAGLIAFLAAGYFVGCMGVARVEYPSDNRYIDDPKARKERLAVFGILGAAAAVLILLVPRNDRTPYSRYLDVTMFRAAPFYGTRGLTDFSQSSSPNTGNNNPSEDLLFYVATDTPRNVITQSFDRYRGREGWTYSGAFSEGRSNWQEEQRQLNYNKLAYDLKKGVSEGKLADFAEDIARLPEIPTKSFANTYMYIQVTDGSNTAVVRHPSGTFAAWITDRNVPIYRNSRDEIFTQNPFGQNPTYTLQYYGGELNEKSARYFSGLSREEYFELLNAAAEEEVIREEAATAYKNAYSSALDYYNRTLDNAITPRIKALAEEITEGLDNDYDKALAIEQWFEKDGFTYDLNFVPQELSAEYFLFTSKRGICTDFATASALLLRAAGIPARYTEGFLVKTDVGSVDMYGRYEVKADQAHAFATAYIPGGGWIEIDGTKYAAVASRAREMQYTMFIIAAAAGTVVMLCIVFRKRLSEAAFAVRYKLGHSGKKLRALYLRTRKLACDISGADPKTTTSGEVRDVISRTLSLENEVGEITDAADAVFYGGAAAKFDEKRLYANYRLLVKARRARGRG